MPPRAAEFTVGGELEADAFLLLDDGLDLAVFDRFEVGGLDRSFREFGARLFQRGGTQQAADMIGAKWRCRTLHDYLLRFLSTRASTLTFETCLLVL